MGIRPHDSLTGVRKRISADAFLAVLEVAAIAPSADQTAVFDKSLAHVRHRVSRAEDVDIRLFPLLIGARYAQAHH